jgi:AraC family transcriptional regulator of adaptative response / DNA-3-methyladenine glycosylase II
MADLLADRAVAGVESVIDGVYRRTISLDGLPGVLEISAGGADYLLFRAHLPYWEGLIHVVERAARIVGTLDDAAPGIAQLAADRHLGPLVAARPGLRVPGAWSGFEAAVSAIAGPEVGAIAAAFGEPVAGLGHGLTHLFPSPHTLASGGPTRVRAIAHAVATGEITLDHATDPADLIMFAPSAAHDIALRLGYRDAFAAADPRVRDALELLRIPPSRAAAWRPWRALATTHLISHVISQTARAA